MTAMPAHDVNASRARDLQQISSAMGEFALHSSSSAIVAQGDAQELLQSVPDHTVSLVLTDPPYHSTKKDNIYGDTSFQHDQHYLSWMAQVASEWKRVLRPNGSLFCFCSSEMSGRLEGEFAKQFNVLSQIVWTKPNDPGFDGWKQKMRKPALRQWYAHSERILFCEPACEGNLKRSPFAMWLRQTRSAAGISTNQLAELIGAYGSVNHGGAVSNWETGRNIPSRDQYQKIVDVFIESGKVADIPRYEDVIRPFMVDANQEFTDVWTFPSVRPYRGKHPAEKPAALLEHAIAATTFAGDIVLDCFAGSGSTALAALRLGRRSVSMEIAPEWALQIADRVRWQELTAEGDLELRGTAVGVTHEGDTPRQLPLIARER
jgi:adenine-specific DNA-methyltransferase